MDWDNPRIVCISLGSKLRAACPCAVQVLDHILLSRPCTTFCVHVHAEITMAYHEAFEKSPIKPSHPLRKQGGKYRNALLIIKVGYVVWLLIVLYNCACACARVQKCILLIKVDYVAWFSTKVTPLCCSLFSHVSHIFECHLKITWHG